MKLAFSTLGCPDWTLAAILDAAGRMGYDGVELRFIEGDDALWARPELTGSGLAETRARLLDAGLVVACVDTRSFFHDPDPAVRRVAFDEAVRSLELAAALGAPGIRVFGDRVQPGQSLDSTRGFVADALRGLADKAAPLGVGAWIESHGDFARAPEMARLLEDVASPAAGLIWDPANAHEAGETPAEGARLLMRHVRHVHIKDVEKARPFQGHEGRSFVPRLPGEGAFHPEDLFPLLEAARYQGFVSFEWEKRWHPDIEGPERALPHFTRWAAPRMRRPRPDAVPPRAQSRRFTRGRLEAEVYPDRASLGAAAAAAVAAHLKDAVARDGRAAAIFASAPSQDEMLLALRADRSIPWHRVTAFHLDEFAGMGPDHPASFRRFLRERLFDHVDARAFHGLQGEAADPEAECARYAALLDQERPSLAILGVGENGHLAFIDPPCCDFADPRDVRVVELDEACRRQQVHDGAFAALDAVPRTALSLTIPRLLRVPSAVAVVPGPAKRAAIAAAVDGPVTRACPASILRRHPDVRLYLDAASSAGV